MKHEPLYEKVHFIPAGKEQEYLEVAVVLDGL